MSPQKRDRSVKIKEVLSALEHFAPLPLQESWDNAGLQIGLTEAEVSGALLCLDVTEAIMDEAIRRGCNVVVSHHPLLFHPLRTIAGKSEVERIVMKAIKSDIAILSMHTNMDNAQGGVNHKMAEKLGLSGVEFIAPKTVESITCGSGVVGILPQPMSALSFIQHVKETFGVASAHCNALLNRPISRVALCGGAGDFLLDDALRAHADAFITGEMHYHRYQGHDDELQICVIGHYESEQFTREVFAEILREARPTLPVVMAEEQRNPIVTI